MTAREKLNELYVDCQNEPNKYSLWEIEFLEDLGEEIFSLKNEDYEFSESQEDKVNEIYEKYME